MAVAGDRVAWLSISPTLSSAYVDLFTSRIGSSATRHVIAAESSADGLDRLSKGGPGDEDVGLLAGRGQTLVFLSWKYREGGALRDERVWRLGPKGGKVLLARVRDVRALAVDEELVAALEGDGRVVSFATPAVSPASCSCDAMKPSVVVAHETGSAYARSINSTLY